MPFYFILAKNMHRIHFSCAHKFKSYICFTHRTYNTLRTQDKFYSSVLNLQLNLIKKLQHDQVLSLHSNLFQSPSLLNLLYRLLNLYPLDNDQRTLDNEHKAKVIHYTRFYMQHRILTTRVCCCTPSMSKNKRLHIIATICF